MCLDSILDLIEGKADLAVIGARLEDVLKVIEKDGIKIDRTIKGYLVWKNYQKDETIHVVETPEISRPLMPVTKGEPQGKVKTFVDFVLREVRK